MLKKTYSAFRNGLLKAKDLPLLFIRLLLAYGFYTPAINKWEDIHSIGEWFDSMNVPLPLFNAYLAATTELLGVGLLVLGLGTRIISIPLIITMLVAIKLVHWDSGFNASDNGFEIPLYYIIMLLVLLTQGAGKLSIDYLVWGRKVQAIKP